MTAPRFVLRYRTWAEMLHDHLYELHGLKTRDVDPTGFHEADHMADIAEEDRPNGWDEHAVTEFYGGWFALDHPEAEPGALREALGEWESIKGSGLADQFRAFIAAGKMADAIRAALLREEATNE